MNRSMGRSPSCSKEEVNKGAWSATEDKILHTYITTHGEGKWREIAQRSGLKRCGKSCRLRWLNYLRPGIKRGNITHDEEDLIIRLHKLLGNRWSLIAGRLPGRTDNEIKNYWNSNLSKKVQQYHNKSQENEQPGTAPSGKKSEARPPIRTKATRCTKVVLPPQQQGQVAKDLDGGSLSKLHEDGNSSVCFMDLDMGTLLSLDIQDSNTANLGRNGIPEHGGGVYDDDDDCSAWISLNLPFLLEDKMLENWVISDDLQAIGESGQ